MHKYREYLVEILERRDVVKLKLKTGTNKELENQANATQPKKRFSRALNKIKHV